MNLFTSKEKNIFTQIQQKAELITNQSSVLAVQKLIDILAMTFPNNRVSPFSQLYEEAVVAKKQKWMHKMKLAVSTFSPGSLFGKALLINKDARINFENQSISYDQQTALSQKEVALSINLRKQGSTTTLPFLQNFFLNCMLTLVNQRNIEHEFNWQQAFKNDEYYFHLVRHPVLHLLRQWLNYMRINPFIFNRILKVVEVVLIREPIIRLQKGERSISISNCHIYGLQVLSQWRLSSLLWELVLLLGESLQQRSRNGMTILNSWIRLWTSFILRGSRYEEQLLVNAQNMLEKGSPLSIVRFESSQQFLDAINIHDESKYTDNLIRQVNSALTNDQWVASPQFLQTLITFLLFLAKYDSYAITPDCKAVGSVLVKLETIFRDEKGKSRVKEALNIYMNIGGQIVAETPSQSQKLSAETGKRQGQRRYDGGMRRGLLSRQEIRELNEWKRPILNGESHILFLLFRWLSCRVDSWRGLPPSEFPTTNLRFLTTPWTFVGFILLLVIIMRLLI